MNSTRTIDPRSPWRKAAALAAIPLCAAALTACSDQGASSAASNPTPANDASNAQTSNAADSAASTATPNPTRTEASDAVASSGDGNASNASTRTNGTSTSDAASTGGDGAQGASASGNDSDLESGLLEAVMSGISVGETFTAAGQQMTACTVGDGYALNITAAGSNTSCEFAREVMRIQTQDLDATNDNIRDHLSPYIKAKSPATGKVYNVKCSENSSGVIVCTGGQNASIYMN